MRHFEFLSTDESDLLFEALPSAFDATSPVEVVADALGATLYLPATRPRLGADLLRVRTKGVLSAVACLEDSIADSVVEAAFDHLVVELTALTDRAADLPLVFVRVRTPDQIVRLVRELGPAARLLAGFVLPKFAAGNGPEYLAAVREASALTGQHLWAMPVIETVDVVHLETRRNALVGIAAVLAEHRDQILAVRPGGTDLAAVYGLRRPKELTVYDIRVVADVLADLVNVLGRPDQGFVVTGPVWEYYSHSERLFKPQLRETPFLDHHERARRAELLADELDGLIREVVMDRANGLFGKTVIHPSHVPVVHALSVVSSEDHSDAVAILGEDEGGAFGSKHRNKMNESKPHRAWAERTLRRAQAFGVARDKVAFVELLAALDRG